VPDDTRAIPPLDQRLVWVSARHLSGWVATTDSQCTDAAPILKWTRGWPLETLLRYCDHHGWTARFVSGMSCDAGSE
jgi:hypothetical protein